MIYTGFQCTVNGVLDEKIVVSFNNHGGSIGLVFQGANKDGTDASVPLTYGGAMQTASRATTAASPTSTPRCWSMRSNGATVTPASNCGAA